MAQLMTQKELDLAQSAMHTLRIAVTSAEKASAGEDAKNTMTALTTHLKATDIALTGIRGSAPYHTGARSIIEEYDRLEKTARNLMADLVTMASYSGPRRGSMSVAQKSKFISEHGAQAFFALPR